LYVETVHLLECIAPPALHVDRFLPPTPIRIMVDHRGQEVGAGLASDDLSKRLQRADGRALLEQPEFREDLLPALMDKAQSAAEKMAPEIIARARREMNSQLEHELQRLRELQKVNRSVRAEEIDLLEAQRQSLEQHLAGARLRLDAVRIIQRGPG
jgi:ATP-dependent helicase HepA